MVILLRDYVVQPGWISPRDFLLWLAIIQAMPGLNFNLAVCLGAMTVAGHASSYSIPIVIGAILASLSIFPQAFGSRLASRVSEGLCDKIEKSHVFCGALTLPQWVSSLRLSTAFGR